MSDVRGSNSYPKVQTDETSRESTSHGNEKYPFQYYLENIWKFDFSLYRLALASGT